MIPFSYRFHGHGGLRYVYKNGKTSRTRLLTVKAINNPRRKNSRIAVVVSKKVHKSAVGRNRIRRKIYEIIRLQISDLKPAHDMVVIVTSGDVLTTHSSMLTLILNDIFTELDLYK